MTINPRDLIDIARPETPQTLAGRLRKPLTLGCKEDHQFVAADRGISKGDDPVISTGFVYPPIPDRRWDWSAYRDGYEPGEPLGSGPTEQAAIDDLLQQEEDFR